MSVYAGQGVTPTGHHPMADSLPRERLVAELEGLREQVRARVEQMPGHAEFVARYASADGARAPAGTGRP